MKLSEEIARRGDVEIDTGITSMYIEGNNVTIRLKSKPVLKKIDMSRCIESAIDCEFTQGNEQSPLFTGRLKRIGSGTFPYRSEWNDGFVKCRPRMNHKHACPYGFNSCPIPLGFIVHIFQRDGSFVIIMSGPESFWNHDREAGGKDNDIIAFEVTAVAEGYTL